MLAVYESLDASLTSSSSTFGRNLIPVSAEILSTPLPPTDCCEDLLRELAFTQTQLQSEVEHAQAVVSKLTGLIGSLKSVILHMDPEKGKHILTGEIAAMEAVLFGPSEEEKAVMEAAAAAKKKKRMEEMKQKRREDQLKRAQELRERKINGTVLKTDGLSISFGKKKTEETTSATTTATATAPSLDNKVTLDPIDIIMDGEEEPDMMALEDYGVEDELADDEENLDESKQAEPEPVPLHYKTSDAPMTLDYGHDISVSTVGSEDTPAPTDFGLNFVEKKPHPRVTNANYWKEFSTQTNTKLEQAAQLEGALKRQNRIVGGNSNSWGVSSFFS